MGIAFSRLRPNCANPRVDTVGTAAPVTELMVPMAELMVLTAELRVLSPLVLWAGMGFGAKSQRKEYCCNPNVLNNLLTMFKHSL